MWINPNTLHVYRSHSDVRAAFPSTSFPESMSDDDIAYVGLLPVTQVQPPEIDPIVSKLDENFEQGQGGQWSQVWSVLPLEAEESQARLVAARFARNSLINSWRLQANRSSFAHGGKTFACDELSRSDIDGITSFVTLSGSLPPGWPGAWKATDNSYLPITSVAEWTAFVASMVAAGNANFAKAQTLKTQLAAATTSAQINAIVW